MVYERPNDPSSIGGVLTDSVKLYRASIVSLILPVFLLELIIVEMRSYFFAAGGWHLDVGHWPGSIAVYAASAYMYGFIIAHVHSVASGSSGIRPSLGIALRRLPPMLVVPLVYGFAVLIAPMLFFALHTSLDRLDILSWIYLLPSLKGLMLLSIIPAVFVAVALFAILLLPVTEGRGPFESLDRSHSLVRRHWWKTFVVVAIAIATFATKYIVIYMYYRHLSDLFDNIPAGYTIAWLTGVAFYAIILPLTVCLMYGAYQNLRLHEQFSTP